MKTLLLGLVTLAAATLGFGAAPTLNDLRNNPLWRPDQTAVTKDFSFSGGVKVKSGARLPVEEIEGSGVVLRLSNGTLARFEVRDTTLLADAAAHVARFTPEQQKLTPTVLRERSELWPYEVRLRNELTLTNGKRVPVGRAFALESFDGREIQAIEMNENVRYTLDPRDTDFYAACLAAVLTLPPSRLYAELAKNVVDARTREKADLLADGGPEYLAIYHAAVWCPYCAEASPEIVAWYRAFQEQPEAKRVRLLIVSNDRNAAQFAEHLRKLDVPALAVPFDKAPRLFLVNKVSGARGLPNFYVVDRAGQLAIPPATGEVRVRVQRVLEAIPALLAAQPNARATE